MFGELSLNHPNSIFCQIDDHAAAIDFDNMPNYCQVDCYYYRGRGYALRHKKTGLFVDHYYAVLRLENLGLRFRCNLRPEAKMIFNLPQPEIVVLPNDLELIPVNCDDGVVFPQS